MKNVELVRQHAALRSLIRRTGHDTSTRALEMQAHWARYLCVLTAGFVENAVRFTYTSYVEKTSSPQTARYATQQILEIRNPKGKRLVEIAEAFDREWGRKLESFLDDNFRKDAVDSIMANRHLIAHGSNSGITIARVEQYLMRIVEIVDYLEQQCDAR